MYDYIIVGAGFAGTVLAELIANILNKKVLVLEKRSHIGGNCYDEIDSQSGVLVHRYGPHLFHTDNEKVVKYLDQFTVWQNHVHKVVAFVDNREISIPFNFHTLYQVFPKEQASYLQQKLVEVYGEGHKIPVLDLIHSKEESLRTLGKFIYEKIFINYTAKQWGKKPEEIDSSITARVPVVTAFDDSYFTDRFQMVPLQGYTHLFEEMLRSENIDLCLNTDAKSLLQINGKDIFFEKYPFLGKVIYTGEIDALFGYRFGKLSYRSLDLRFEVIDQEYYQSHSVVNFPNEYTYTRITEFKHIHSVKSSKTTILKEYPQEYERGKNIPFYPLLNEENQSVYRRYENFANQIPNLITIGRLAEFRYYDMDDIVLRALELFESEIRYEI